MVAEPADDMPILGSHDAALGFQSVETPASLAESRIGEYFMDAAELHLRFPQNDADDEAEDDEVPTPVSDSRIVQ